MKKVLLILFSILIFNHCTNVTHTVQTNLTPEQRNFLSIPSLNRSLTFNENGMLYDLMVDTLHISTQMEKQEKAGLLTTPGYNYLSENGYVYYRFVNTNAKIKLSAYSSLTYGKGGQYVSIIKSNVSGSREDLVFPIDFNRIILYKTIGGIDYTGVVLSTTDNKDSLFWRQDIGVLGWKEHSTGIMTYQDLE